MVEEELREEKDRVKQFYEKFRWRRNAAGAFNDTALFTDMSAILGQYYKRGGPADSPIPSPDRVHVPGRRLRSRTLRSLCGVRVRLQAPGVRRLLGASAARGARASRHRGALCLRGHHASTIQGGVFDAVFSGHVIYHIPADEQGRAITELQRSLSPGRVGVIIYESPTQWFTALAEWVKSVKRRLERVPGVLPLWRALRRLPASPKAGPRNEVTIEASGQKLYFHAHSYGWLRGRMRSDCMMEVRCFRVVGPDFTRILVPANFLADGS
jgi:hypothetical protein